MNILSMIFGVFALLGAADRILGNRLKLGEEFEKGVLSVGPLAVAMVGMITVAPFLANLMIPIFRPFSSWLGIDPSFIGGFVANDMGGASIAIELSDTVWSRFHGLVVAAMMGVTICFTIPVALKTVEERYHKDMLSGILCGVATVPVGCLVGGLVMKLGFLELIRNLIPVIVISLLTCVGLVLNPVFCRKVFNLIGQIVLIVITAGLGVGIFTYITGIVLIPGLASVKDGFIVVSEIAMILAGVFPLIAVISKVFKKPFGWLGRLLGINEASVVGLISSLANSIPMFSLTKEMNSKGIVINFAFATSASFVLGDHLAFTMAFDKTAVFGMMVGKFVGGIFAVVIANLLFHFTRKKEKTDTLAH